MGPQEALRRALAGYATFEGRSRRSEYWWFSLVHGAAVGVPTTFGWALLVLGLLLRGDAGWALVGVGAVVAGAGYLMALALVVPYYAVSARRLHDTGRSALWLLLVLVPYASVALLGFALEDGRPGPNQPVPTPRGARPRCRGLRRHGDPRRPAGHPRRPGPALSPPGPGRPA